MKKKVLLFGRGGQVGSEFVRRLAGAPAIELTALDRAGSGTFAGDLTDPEAAAAAVRSVAPDVVINAAAFTSRATSGSSSARSTAV